MTEVFNQNQLANIYDTDGIFRSELDDGRQGDCFDNTKRLIRLLQEQGVNLSGWKAVVVEWNGPIEFGWGIFPDDAELRNDGKSNAGVRHVDGGLEIAKWGYHVCLMDNTGNIYDLTASKEHFGEDVESYIEKVFPLHVDRLKDGMTNEIHFRVIDALDFVDSPYEQVKESGITIQFDDITSRIVSRQIGKSLEEMRDEKIAQIQTFADSPVASGEAIKAWIGREHDTYQRRAMPIPELLQLQTNEPESSAG